jgi:dipeptidyl aminopeptidase/acylaminoacyl peptidase
MKAALQRGRTLGEPRISPDGMTVAFVSSQHGSTSIALVPLLGGPERILTSLPEPGRPRPFGGGTFSWCPDSQGIVYASKGDLWYQSILGGSPRQLTQQASELSASCPVVSPDGVHVVFVVSDRYVAVATIEESTLWPRNICNGSADFVADPSWSADGEFLVWQAWDVPSMPWDESRWVVASFSGLGPVAAVGEKHVQVQQPRFSPVGSDIAYLCDRSGWLNMWLFGPEHDVELPLVDEPFEHGGPSWGAGQRSFAWSPDGGSIAFNRNERGFGRLCVVDCETKEVRELGKAHHGGLDWFGDTIVAVRSGGRTPPQIVAYNVSTGGRRTLAFSAVVGCERNVPEPELVTCVSDDGEVLHARLYRSPDPLPQQPLLCWLHGGPTDQWTVTWNSRIALWLSRGWSVLVPDYRGSTGHGRAYTQALAGRWGERDVCDVAAFLQEALRQKWGKRLVLMGGSAGGFTVLHVLARYPDLCVGGIALYPVSDLFDLAQSTHRFEAHYTDTLVGPLPESNKRYHEASPITHASKITAPLLLLHGSQDHVVPVTQSEAFARLCPSAELHVYEGEGHGWRLLETAEDEYVRVSTFLERNVLRLPV